MKILVDYDSTLNDLIFKWVAWCNVNENKNFKVSDIKDYEYIHSMYEEPYKFFEIEPYRKNIIKPFKNSKEFIQELKKYGEVIIITDTVKEMRKEKQEHINKHFDLPVIFSDRNKQEFCDDKTILIDDNFYHIYNSIKEKNCYGLLFRNNDLYRYNDYMWQHHKFKRCNNYNIILNEIKKIKKGK